MPIRKHLVRSVDLPMSTLQPHDPKRSHHIKGRVILMTMTMISKTLAHQEATLPDEIRHHVLGKKPQKLKRSLQRKESNRSRLWKARVHPDKIARRPLDLQIDRNRTVLSTKTRIRPQRVDQTRSRAIRRTVTHAYIVQTTRDNYSRRGSPRRMRKRNRNYLRVLSRR